MKPVHQTILTPPNGNCFQAAIASILELPLEDVPHFCGNRNANWFQDTQEWMNKNGYFYFSVGFCKSSPDLKVMYRNLRDVLCIACGKSPRGNWQHAVVGVIKAGFVFEMIHDPHPDGTGLDGNPEYLEFFVALDPSRLVKR